MEKQIFIRSFEGFDNLSNFAVLGLVNLQLGDRANAKQIVSVVIHTEINSFREETEGYLITYLESEMIASKDDLRNAYCEGIDFQLGNSDYEGFDDWFNENFNK